MNVEPLRWLMQVVCGAAMLAAVGAPSAAHGQPNPFSAPSPPDVTAVAPGRTFINASVESGLHVGEIVTLTIKNSASQVAASVKQVRLFRLGPTSNVPLRYGFFGDCDVFLTTVISVQPVKDRGVSALQFDALSRPFLEINAAKTAMTDARWMAVFETTTTEPGDVFRIRTSHTSNYFEGGWIFTLLADKKTYSPAEIAEAGAAQLPGEDLLREAAIGNKTRPCHIVTMNRVASDEARRELLACANEEKGATGL